MTGATVVTAAFAVTGAIKVTTLADPQVLAKRPARDVDDLAGHESRTLAR